MEVNELPSDSPALEMRSQEEAENKEDKEDKEEKGDQSEEEAIGKEEEDESVAIASVPSTSLKMPDLGPTSLAVCIILCLRHLSSCSTQPKLGLKQTPVFVSCLCMLYIDIKRCR